MAQMALTVSDITCQSYRKGRLLRRWQENTSL